MPIAKKPKRDTNASVAQDADHRAEAFISGATKTLPAADEAARKAVMLRFDPDLLRRVDDAAKRRGISRSAWIQYTVSRALDQGEG